jgi:hypothetical protein
MDNSYRVAVFSFLTPLALSQALEEQRLKAVAEVPFLFCHRIFSYYARGCTARCMGDRIIRYFPPGAGGGAPAPARRRGRGRRAGPPPVLLTRLLW